MLFQSQVNTSSDEFRGWDASFFMDEFKGEVLVLCDVARSIYKLCFSFGDFSFWHGF